METLEIKRLREALRDYHAARQIERRLIRFEDNFTRHIALNRTQWATYDWLIEERGFSDHQLNDAAFLMAQEWPNALPMYPMPFEKALRITLRDVIAVFASTERRDRGDASNDNDQFWALRDRSF